MSSNWNRLAFTAMFSAFIALAGSAHGSESQTERDVLVDLYQSTGGDDWFVNEGWLEEDDHCDWHGVICREGQVNALILADNNLTGELPESLMALSLNRLDMRRTGSILDPWYAAFPPGLDLCWNNIESPQGELAEFVDQRHHGGRYGDCQRPRRGIDPTISGSWFAPERNGEGFVQHFLDDGNVLLMWFTYFGGIFDDQAWFLGVSSPHEDSVWFQDLTEYAGRFGHGMEETDDVPFRLSVNPLSSTRQHIAYSRSVVLGGSMTGLASFGLSSLRHDQAPLTRLAGSTCDNQQPHQWISGAWYDPERDGEGFMVEVNEDGRGVAYWFTYLPDNTGRQAWMMGDGEFDGTTLSIDSLTRPVGTRFGEDFNADDIEFNHWGSLVMEFEDDLNGHIWFDSVDEDFGSGDYPIERLARPKLAECD